MKLTAEQAQHVADQLQGQTIPEEHPNTPQLREAVGDHTFFLNNNGLHIVEAGLVEGGADTDAAALKVASWSQEQEGHLFLHEPEPAQVVTIDPGPTNVA